LKIKGNQFKSKRTLLNYLKENNLLIKWVSDFYG
jgi:ribosomal protein L19E